jgi:uncharacterized protein YkwD
MLVKLSLLAALIWGVMYFLLNQPQPATQQIALPIKTSQNSEQLFTPQAIDPVTTTYIQEEPLAYINQLRQQSGLYSFEHDKRLDEAARVHAKYIRYSGHVGHMQENSSSPYYSAYSPLDRGINAGVKSQIFLENISRGQRSVKASVDGLMSAVYHRFNFLSFHTDKLGYAIDDNVYVYTMAHSGLDRLCHEVSYEGELSYYDGVCPEPTHRIEKEQFDFERSRLLEQAPAYVIWPPRDGKAIPTAFFEEEPDPLPDMQVSGYPISIEFNQKQFPNTITLERFDIFDEHDQQLTNVRLLDAQAFQGGTLLASQFVLFPLERLTHGKRYRAEIQYRYNERLETITWSFTTDYPKEKFHVIEYEPEATRHIVSNEPTIVYVVPNDGNDLLGSYDITYPKTVKLLEHTLVDPNTMRLHIQGNEGDVVNVKFENDQRLKFMITNE